MRANGETTIFDLKAGAVEWDTWLHYTGTYDKKAGGGGLYIDGELIQEVSGNASIADDWRMDASFGYNIDNARPFTGLMDDFCL